MSWYRLRKILKSSYRINFNWCNRVNFKLILQTLLFKSLFSKTNLNCSYILLLDIFSIVTQWGFCKYVLSEKIKTDIFTKSGFRSRKLIVIVYVWPVLQTSSLNTKNNTFSSITLFLSLLSKRVTTSISIFTCVITADSFQTWPFSAKRRNSTYLSVTPIMNVINFFNISLANLYFHKIRSNDCFWKF